MTSELDGDPLYPDPTVQTAAPAASAGARPSRRRLLLAVIIVAAAAVLAAVLVVTLGGGRDARGATSAQQAAQRFVTALNTGDGDAAVAISCSSFAAQARSEAHEGVAGFRFTLGPVRSDGSGSATAQLTQLVQLPGAAQRSSVVLTVQRVSGRWLACGVS
ncbi:MAG: hypothetical protein ACR2LF_11065 [Jatrophihabitantaceae bacterium]